MKELKRVAVEKGTSLSQIFNEIILEYLERVKALSGTDWKRDPFFQIGKRPAGVVEPDYSGGPHRRRRGGGGPERL